MSIDPMRTTLDEALARMAAQLDEIFAESMCNLEILLLDHGATAEELAAELAIAERTRVEERARVLGELRDWLQRDGETLQ